MGLIPEEESPPRPWRWMLLLVAWAAFGTFIGMAFSGSVC